MIVDKRFYAEFILHPILNVIGMFFFLEILVNDILISRKQTSIIYCMSYIRYRTLNFEHSMKPTLVLYSFDYINMDY